VLPNQSNSHHELLREIIGEFLLTAKAPEGDWLLWLQRDAGLMEHSLGRRLATSTYGKENLSKDL
jgi:hypothetical protein